MLLSPPSSPIALLRGGDVQRLDDRALRRLATTVVPLRRRHVGVPGELLHRRYIHLGIAQVGHDDV